MSNSKISYNNLSDIEKLNLIKKHYIDQQQSFADIADMYNTYANRVRRDAIKLKIKIRDKSEAQKNALKSGKHKHPTKGTHRSDEIKQKIGEGVIDSWKSLSETQFDNRRKKSKENWDKLSHDEKQNMQKSAIDAIRLTSKLGSKLEKFILNSLLATGYTVEFHKEHTLVNTRLQIDLFLPKIGTAIEIDGPSHFKPVWGQDALKKNISYDQKKEGLILGKGWNLVRIKQTNDFSKARANIVFDKLINILNEIIANNHKNTTITIED